MDILGMSFQVIGGLSLFLLGMKYMSEGIQTTAGKRLRSMIAAVTDNRFMGCLTGCGVTSLIQSSSITTVMLIGFVNAGVMTLAQAFSVILGANIGTTITGWIVSLDILAWGLPIMAVAVFCYIFGKSDRFKFFSMVVMGIGMVFYGLEVMKQGIEPLNNLEVLTPFFRGLTPDTFPGLIKCILVGAGVTAVIQSSSATVAITITLAQTGVIGFEAAVALVLGENIGTTITAYLTSLGANTVAKRVAWSHIISKTIGVILLASFFHCYVHGLNLTLSVLGVSDVAKSIALAHTIFNVILVVLFLAFAGPFTRFICWMVPEKKADEAATGHITYLDIRMLNAPTFGIQQSMQEIIRMGDRAQIMFGDLRVCLQDEDNKAAEREIFEGEAMLDEHQKEVVNFLAKLVRGNISMEIAGETRKQIRLADEYESVSDYVQGILKLLLRARQQGLSFSEQAMTEILAMHDRVASHVAQITHATRSGVSVDFMREIRTEDAAITHLFKDYRAEHMNRIVAGSCDVLSSIVYSDIMQSYRKIKEHAYNIAEALMGEK